MTQSLRQYPATTMLISGLSVLAIGILATYGLLQPEQVLILPVCFHGVTLFGPIIAAIGAIMTLCGFSFPFRRALIMVGLIMLIVGGFPWIYTSHLTGGRPGNEAAGMLGTIIFICVGVPGVLMTALAFLLYLFKRN